MRPILPALLALAALALSACSKTETASTGPDNTPRKYAMSEADKALVAQKFPTAVESPTGLLSIVTKPGTGTAKPRTGQVIIVNYSLRLLDGTFCEASPLGEPIKFPIGVNRVIKGWDEALPEMTKGEKRTLIIPHYLAYGMTGSPPKIPPYATLVFDVELVDFK